MKYAIILASLLTLSGCAAYSAAHTTLLRSEERSGLEVKGKAATLLAAREVAYQVRILLGPSWVPVGLRIMRIESGGRCEARNPISGAAGLGQLLFSSAEELMPGFGHRRTDCHIGAHLLALHMKRCLEAGARTPRLMVYCHQHGWGSLLRRYRHHR